MLFSGKIISLQKSEQFTGQQSWVLFLLAMHIPTYGMMNRLHLIMRTGLRQSQAQNKTKEILIGLEFKLPSTTLHPAPLAALLLAGVGLGKVTVQPVEVMGQRRVV